MSKAWYALRRTLPPWNVDRNLAELVEFCRQNSIDEVIAKVDSEEFTHAIPTLGWLDGYLPVLKRMKSELNDIGVVFSINPWVTQVHCDRGRDLKAVFPDMDLIVGHDGTRCKACACPLSEGWRKQTKELWYRYASLEPDVLWIEDDIRLLNHQPVVYGCFCPLHVDEFSKRAGEKVTREELVAALMAPGEPHPYRKIWLDLNRDITNDVGRFFEQCVHEVSPQTKLGLMCSMPNAHAIEGRDWEGFTRALAGDQRLVARPCMVNYNEDSPRGLYESEFFFRSTHHCLGRDAIIQTEVENWPFTTYSKSAHFTFMQCALSFIFGADGVTMNLYDHMGTPLGVTPEFGEMLREKKPYLNALAEACHGGVGAGVRLIHAANGSYKVRTSEGSGFMALSAEGYHWRFALEPLGLPVTFDESPVVALSGQVIRSFSRKQLEELLSGSVLLDLGALKCLIDAGLGDMAGVTIKREFRKYDEPLAAEEYLNPDFGGAERTYLTLTIPHLGGNALMADVEPAPGAQVVSRVVDPDAAPRYPFLTLYENQLGGRVAVFPIDIEEAVGVAFLHPHRKRQMEAVINWLSRGKTPMVVSGGAYPLSFRIDHGSRSVVGAFNLSLDDWPEAVFDLSAAREPERVQLLGDDALWRESEEVTSSFERDRLRISYNRPLKALSLAVISVHWANP